VKPRKNLCAACGKELEDSYAFITGGALFLLDLENSELRQEMEGFLHFCHHVSGTKASSNIKSWKERSLGNKK